MIFNEFKRYLTKKRLSILLTALTYTVYTPAVTAGCVSEKIYSESKIYLGCKITWDDGREDLHDSKGLTEYGCDTYCRSSSEFDFDLHDYSNNFSYTLTDFSDEKNNLPQLSKYDDGIVEALQTEVVFTHAHDSKPIMASYGAGPCIILAGYDKENKVGFLAHISTPNEIWFGGRGRGQVISYHLNKILKGEKGNFDLYITGGYQGQSEGTREAISQWIESTTPEVGSMKNSL